MNVLNISFSSASTELLPETSIIRLGLLIATQTYAAGDKYLGIHAESTFDKNKGTLKEKLKHIEDNETGHRALTGERNQEVEQLKFSYQMLSTVKYKSALQLKQMKQIEANIQFAFEFLCNHHIAFFEKAGFTALKKFAGTILHINVIPVINPEIREEGNALLMSEVLLDRLNTETSNETYLVDDKFEKYVKKQNSKIVILGGEINMEAELLRAEKIIVLPNIVLLSTNEMEMVREHLTEGNQEFRKKMDEWCNKLMTIEFSPENFEAFNDTFSKEIQPEIVLLQQEIEKNDRLRLLKSRSADSVSLETNLYLTSLGYYWDYLIDEKTVKEETIEVLKQHKEYDFLRKQTCIIIEGKLINYNDLSEDKDELLTAKLKTLTI